VVRGVSWSDFEETQPMACWLGVVGYGWVWVWIWVSEWDVWGLGVLGLCRVGDCGSDLGREGKMHEGYWGVVYEQICVQKG